MKESTKKILITGLCMLVVLTGITVFTFIKGNNIIENGYFEAQGKAAENFAILTAETMSLSDKDVERLKNYTYQELQNSEENKNLYHLMSNQEYASKVDYAYVLMHLQGKDVKYQVTEETQATFDAEVGTLLDMMFLLDASPNGTSDHEDKTEAEERYTYYIEEDEHIFKDAPTFLLNRSEWGDHICGYAPLYSTEGTFIGVVGVELQTDDYESYRMTALAAMGIPILVAVLCAFALLGVLFHQYRKIQHFNMYTDFLTKTSNRNYYNTQFAKWMNNNRNGKSIFALMICDIDFFKKINDEFGHDVGDQVLEQLGQILLDAVGKYHVCRFGGEEFVIGIWMDNPEEQIQLIQKLFAAIQQERFGEPEIKLSISLGGAYCQTQHISGWLLSEMLKTADGKLYEVKENGRKDYRLTEFVEPENKQEK